MFSRSLRDAWTRCKHAKKNGTHPSPWELAWTGQIGLLKLPTPQNRRCRHASCFWVSIRARTILTSIALAYNVRTEITSSPPAYGLPEHPCQTHNHIHHACVRFLRASMSELQQLPPIRRTVSNMIHARTIVHPPTEHPCQNHNFLQSACTVSESIHAGTIMIFNPRASMSEPDYRPGCLRTVSQSIQDRTILTSAPRIGLLESLQAEASWRCPPEGACGHDRWR